jgi:bifunctional DNA-binding transcriptional regulator/antitoxin component of YhaV-PrlF toxin-antitoxin module
MKLVELRTRVGNDGRIVVPEDSVNAAKLCPGDEVFLYLEDRPCDACELKVPVELLEEAGIPEDSDLEVICIDGTIVIMETDILDNRSEDLSKLFEYFGINIDTVREVMRKEGVYV